MIITPSGGKMIKYIVTDLNKNQREILDIEIAGIDTTDYPKFCDAYISKAVWADSNKELTDDEVDHVNETQPDLIHMIVYHELF